ncbi:hypothetical protein AVEN_133746-1 [Araneus ventricosus]|uniref:Uncharacterized protein n=1 Tax=Araneus ventricosus TaxID=182803 RepID=A0A4Y2B7C1_ARAVE|nr:hypothetical protein AVEN_133746-1 [Araneus ventricosus]
MFGSDTAIVLTSMQEKDESLMRQDRDCRRRDPISPIPGEECVLLCPCCVGSCIIVQEQSPSTQESWSGPTAPFDFPFFPALKSALSVPHFRTCSSNWRQIYEELPSIAGHRFLLG